MRYLSSRTEYLKSAKYKVTNESYAGAGPFANDIAWGDSLVGRLLNSIIRKTKIGVNLVRIKSVISRLNEQFEYILNDAELSGTQMSDELKASLDRLIMSLYIGELHTYLQETDEKGNTLLEEVSNATKKAIDDVESYELKDEKSDPDRKELVLLLNEFLTEIDNMKVEDTEEEDTEEEDTEEEDTEEEETKEEETGLVVLEPTVFDKKKEELISNGWLLKIPTGVNKDEYKQTSLTKSVETTEKNPEGKSDTVFWKKKESDKKSNILEDYHIYMDNIKSIYGVLKSYQTLKSNQKSEFLKGDKSTKPEIKDKQPKGRDNTPANTDNTNQEEETGIVTTQNNSLVFESKTPNTLAATRSFYDYMMSDNKNLDELKSLIGRYDRMSSGKKWKSPPKEYGGRIVFPQAKGFVMHGSEIKKIYDNVKKSKNDTPAKYQKISENLASLLSKSDEFSKRIKDLYNVSKTGDFTGIEDVELKKSLTLFNSTLGFILNNTITESKKEGKLLKYESFRKIFEADETEEPKPKFANQKATREEESYDTSIPWNKVFNPDYMKKWKITDEEKNRLLSEADNITNDPNGLYLIEGIDPIMEIVRIFNRAYKLHTTQTIPGARSNGKVTNLKMSEYTYVGSNSGGAPTKNQDSSGFSVGIGPFRNNAIFNKWEDAVTKILGNSKYQVLFNDKTIIQVGTADKRDGKSLLKFIRNMLDGDGLYKNNGGAQSKFIEEYFGTKVETEKLAFGGNNEVEEISENADMTKEPIVCEFKTTNEINFNQRSIHTIDNGKDVYYLMFLNTDDKFAYFKYSKSFYHFNKYLKGDVKVEKGSLDSVKLKESPISYGRISERVLPITVNDKLKFKSIKIGGENGFNTDGERVVPEEINLGNIKSTNSLSSEDGLFKLESTKKTSSGKSDGNRYNDYAQALKKDVKPKEDESNPGQ